MGLTDIVQIELSNIFFFEVKSSETNKWLFCLECQQHLTKLEIFTIAKKK